MAGSAVWVFVEVLGFLALVGLLANCGKQRLHFFGVRISLRIAVLGGTDQKLGAGSSRLDKQVIDVAFSVCDGDDFY
jgi:hypothetical protein